MAYVGDNNQHGKNGTHTLKDTFRNRKNRSINSSNSKASFEEDEDEEAIENISTIIANNLCKNFFFLVWHLPREPVAVVSLVVYAQYRTRTQPNQTNSKQTHAETKRTTLSYQWVTSQNNDTNNEFLRSFTHQMYKHKELEKNIYTYLYLQ